MPDIKLRDGSGVERTYEGVDTITVPLADGTGSWTYGLTDEQLSLDTYNNEYFLTRPLLHSIYGSRIKGEGVRNLQHLASYSSSEDLSNIVIDVDTNDSISCSCVSMFNDSPQLKKLPQFTGNFYINVSSFNNIFTACPYLTQEEYENFLGSIKGIGYGYYYSTSGTQGGSGSTPSFSNTLSNVYGIKKINHQILATLFSDKTFDTTSTIQYYGIAGYGNYACSEILNIPIIKTNGMTSNGFTNSLSYVCRLSRWTFYTNNNEPIEVNWKSQTLDFSKSNLGYMSSSYESYLPYAGIDTSHNIADGITSATIAGTKAKYDIAKESDEDWYVCASNSVTYDGKSKNLALLFSRYNHDSAVETINSLPDTSAYLAQVGGTNTIKFNNYSGAETDGGAPKDLTPEEIAVAAAKGWTVTLVD